MKIQLALDMLSDKRALKIAKEAGPFVDIIEAGTPLIKSQGIGIARKLKRAFPSKTVLADLKTMDTGFLEAELAFRQGADIATVCASSSDFTVRGALKAARKYKKKVLVDLLSVKNPVKRAKELEKLRPHYICAHIGIDEQNQGMTFPPGLKNIRHLALAGGIKPGNLKKVIKYKPDIIIVGSAITGSKEPAKIARQIKEMVK